MVTGRSTKAELHEEIESLRQRVAEMEAREHAPDETEEALKEIKDEYRNLVENTKDSIIIIDLDGNVQFANKATEELTGYSMEDGISMNLKDVIPLKYWPKSLSMLRKAGKGEAVPYFESIIRKKNGSLVPVESGGQAIIREGKVTGVQVITRDITERRKAEDSLKESESRFRRLVEHSLDGIILVDEVGNVIEWNTGQERITGRKRDEMLGRPIWDIDLQPLLSDERTTVSGEQLKDGFFKFSRTGQAPWLDEPRELEIERPDGTRCTVQSVSYSIAARNGWMTGIICRDVTEQKRRERAQRDTQERYRELVEKAGVAILIDDEKGDILYFNDRFAELHGYTAEEMKEQPLDSLIYADDVEMVRRYHRQRMKGLSAPSRYEFKGLKKDGSVVYLEVDAVILEEGDRIVGTRSYFWDVTDRKLADDELRGERDKLKQVFESMVDGVYIVNQDHDIEYVNPVLIADFGPYEGRKCYAYFHDREEVCPWCKNQEVWAGGTVRWEWYSFKNDMTYDLIDTPLYNADGTISKLEIFRDITERKQNEEALKRSEAFLGSIGRMAKVGGWELDAETLEPSWTEETYRIHEVPLDYKPSLDEAIGFYHPEDQPKLERAIQRALEHGEPYDLEIRLITAKGRYLWTHSICEPHVVNGKTVKLTGAFQDITASKLVGQELLRSHEQLRALSAHIQEAREGERANISREIHDELGQNLTAIKMDLSWLQKELLPDKGALIEKTESISKLVDDTIQRVKRISAELRPGLLDDLGISAAIEWQAGEFERTSGIGCEIVLDPEDLVLDHDRTTAIFRVFQEVLSNVVRHSEATRVEVNLKAKSGWVTLEVSDNGRGITKEELSHPTSLGLMGMRERVSILRGEFKITGKKGKGTKVTLRVPFKE